MGEAGLGQRRAGADQRSRVLPGEHRDDRGTRQSVADPHFAGAEHIGFGSEPAGQSDARLQRRDRLKPGHRRAFREVARTGGDLAVENLPGGNEAGEVRRDAEVGHHHPGSGGAGDRVDARTARDEVVHHLHGHARRLGGDPFGDDAVVARHQHHGFARDRKF